MTTSERLQMVREDSHQKGLCPLPSHFNYDMHKSAIERYAHLPRWEKFLIYKECPSMMDRAFAQRYS